MQRARQVLCSSSASIDAVKAVLDEIETSSGLYSASGYSNSPGEWTQWAGSLLHEYLPSWSLLVPHPSLTSFFTSAPPLQSFQAILSFITSSSPQNRSIAGKDIVRILKSLELVSLFNDSGSLSLLVSLPERTANVYGITPPPVELQSFQWTSHLASLGLKHYLESSDPGPLVALMVKVASRGSIDAITTTVLVPSFPSLSVTLWTRLLMKLAKSTSLAPWMTSILSEVLKQHSEAHARALIIKSVFPPSLYRDIQPLSSSISSLLASGSVSPPVSYVLCVWCPPQNLLLPLLSAWSSPLFISSGSPRAQCRLSSALCWTISRSTSRTALSNSLSTLLSAVSTRLAVSAPVTRTVGMIVAQEYASTLTRLAQAEGDDSAFPSLSFEWDASVLPEPVSSNPPELSMALSNLYTWTPSTESSSENQKNNAGGGGGGRSKMGGDDDADPFDPDAPLAWNDAPGPAAPSQQDLDDGLIPQKGLHESSVAFNQSGPDALDDLVPLVHLRDAFAALKTGNDAKAAELHGALTSLPNLLAQKPDDTSEVAVELAARVLHLENVFSWPKFDAARDATLTALTVAFPKGVVPLLTDCFYGRNFHLSHRMTVLDALGKAAMVLADRGALHPVVNEFLFPLLNGADGNQPYLRLLSEDTLVLTRLLTTVGLVCGSAGPSDPAVATRAPQVAEWLWALRSAAVDAPDVRAALLWAWAALLESVPAWMLTSPGKLLTVLQDMTPWLVRVLDGENDSKAGLAAAKVASIIHQASSSRRATLTSPQSAPSDRKSILLSAPEFGLPQEGIRYK